MAEHERATKKKQDDSDQKHRVRQPEPESSFDRFLAYEQGISPVTKSPFRPDIGRHASLLAQAHSDELKANHVLHLQQTYGNKYVQRLLKSMAVQAKLTVNAPNDIYEQEADRVAETVTRALATKVQRQEEEEEEEEVQAKPFLQRQEEEEEEVQAKPFLQRQEEEEEKEEEVQAKPFLQRQEEEEEEEEVQAKPFLQRQEEEEEEEEVQAKPFLQRQEEEEEEEVQAKPSLQRQEEEEEEEVQEKPFLQRQEEEEEEEEVQAKPFLQRQEEEEEEEEEEEVQEKPFEGQPATVSEGLEKIINNKRGGGEPLDDVVRQPMEQAFNSDFGEVRIHTDPEADMLNQQLKAKAFTTGRDIFFRGGEYSPGSDSGRKLVAHELTHVIQQTGISRLQRQTVIQRNLFEWLKKKFGRRRRRPAAPPLPPRGARGPVPRILPPLPPRGARGPVPRVAPQQPTKVIPVLTPQDNFAGRSRSRFGIGEEVNLGFITANPAGRTAASFGGLNWSVEGTNATVANAGGNNGLGTLKVGSKGELITLKLKVATGARANTVVASRRIPVIVPSAAHMEQQGAGLRHYSGFPSVGFLGNVYFYPKDVSFKWVQWKEGYGQALSSGAFLNMPWGTTPHLHVDDRRSPGALKKFIWCGITGGTAKGSVVNVPDQVYSGALRNRPNYAQPSEFTWNIPWFYKCTNPNGDEMPLTTAVQHATCDATGKMTIEKKGAGPFSANKNDPDSEWG
jgi:hypothetical protein